MLKFQIEWLLKCLSSGHTRTHTRSVRERGREQGQPATEETRGKNKQRQTIGKGNTQQAGRTKKGKGGREGEEAHRSPTLAPRRANSAKQNRQQSKNSSETIEAGQHREGTNTLLRM